MRHRLKNQLRWALLTVFLLIGCISFYLVKTRDTASISTNKQITVLIDTFEQAILNKDATRALALFTEPENERDSSYLKYLQSHDLDQNTFPRLFTIALFNYTIPYYTIDTIQKNNGIYTVTVTENRTLYDNTTGINNTALYRRYIDCIVEDRVLKIVNYYVNADTKGKYTGFDPTEGKLPTGNR